MTPSPAGEGRGEENKIRHLSISPHPTFSRWRRLSPRDKVRVSEYLRSFNTGQQVLSCVGWTRKIPRT